MSTLYSGVVITLHFTICDLTILCTKAVCIRQYINLLVLLEDGRK